jgi:hypothetical protein
VRPFAKRQIVEVLVGEHQLPVQQACRVVRLSRAAFYRPPVPASRRDAAVIAALTDVVARYPRWGLWKLFNRMRTDARPWNHWSHSTNGGGPPFARGEGRPGGRGGTGPTLHNPRHRVANSLTSTRLGSTAAQ